MIIPIHPIILTIDPTFPHGDSTGVEERALSQLLNEMDGIQQSEGMSEVSHSSYRWRLFEHE